MGTHSWVFIRIEVILHKNICCGYSLESPQRGHNICFYGELTKIILQLSSDTLICSSNIHSLFHSDPKCSHRQVGANSVDPEEQSDLGLQCCHSVCLCPSLLMWKCMRKLHCSDFRNIAVIEPAHELMVLFVLRNLTLQMRRCSHPVGLDDWFLVRPFFYFHTSCARTAKARLSLHWSSMW